jgi:general secretion pathway protein F
MPEPPNAEPISLKDLVALNEEIAALVRAGIPLEVGLGGSRSLPRKLQAITERLRLEMERGASLPQALRNCGADLPASYLTLVEAGLRSNRLSDALIAASTFARTLMDMQQHVRSALIYPMLVLSAAYVFFLLIMQDLLPRLAQMLVQFHTAPGFVLSCLEGLSRTILYWGPAIPLVAIAAAMWMGIIPTAVSRRPMAVLRRLSWIPWMRRILVDVQSASFCQLMSLLVEQEVPLADALELASSGSADRELNRECHRVAADLRGGTPLNQALRGTQRIPAFTRWMLTAGQTQSALPAVMSTLADIYRHRARSQTDLFRMSAPLILTIVIGGGAVAGYCLLLFIPMRNLFMDLSASLH